MKQSNDLGFNGQVNGSSQSGYNAKYQTKAAGIPSAKENYGRGPTRAGTTGDSVPNPTAAKGKINGGASANCPANPDKINVGRGPTKGVSR